jgi:Acyl-CoA dehydrogenase, C-terminal domain
MHGGNGYIEDFVTPRLLRDAQVLTVWEGTANILGLEVLRLIEKYKAEELFLEEMSQRLRGVAHLPSEWTYLVENKLIQLQNLSKSLRTASPNHKTFHSKKAAELMVKIFESIVALEQAASGDRRAMKVMEVFLEETWKSSYLFNEEMRTVNYFSEIVLNSKSEKPVSVR